MALGSTKGMHCIRHHRSGPKKGRCAEYGKGRRGTRAWPAERKAKGRRGRCRAGMVHKKVSYMRKGRRVTSLRCVRR